MSFFGFDTSMPSGGDGLDERLRRMAEADENIQIYDFEGGGLDALGAQLDESLDAFNEDTFDIGGGVGRDFDFAGNTAAFVGSTAPTPSLKPTGASTQNGSYSSKPAGRSPFGAGSSFDADPLLGPVRPSSGFGQQQSAPSFQHRTSSLNNVRSVPSPLGQQQAQPSFQRNDSGSGQQQQKPRMRTVEEIEAEMAANQQQQRQSPAMGARPTPPPLQQRMTVEEVEMEMLRQAQASRQQQQQPQAPQVPQQSGVMQRQDSMQALAQQAQMMAMKNSDSMPRQQDQAPAPPVQQPQQQLMPLPGVGRAGSPPPMALPPPSYQQLQTLHAQISYLQGQGSAANPMHQQATLSALNAIFPMNGGISLSDPNLLSLVESKIREAEVLEAKRLKKAAKIHRMAKYNNLMSQGDKDFITRIQVSQLLNTSGENGKHDPYLEDFYFVIMQSMRMRVAAANAAAMGNIDPLLQQQQQQQLPPQQQQRQGGRQGGNNQNRQQDRRMTRRENAMNRMAAQVQRIVDDAKKKPRATQLSLEGALGKIAIRTRSAPRPLLQVNKKDDSDSASSPINTGSFAAAHLNQSTGPSNGPGKPLDRRQVLIALEKVYDIVLELEQSRRAMGDLAQAAQAETAAAADAVALEASHPEVIIPSTARDALAQHEEKYNALVASMWKGMKVMEPLDISVPHPFISLLSATKGKKLLPRVLRHLDEQKTLTLLTLLVACFDTLDVVRDAPILDTNANDPLSLASMAATTNRRSRKMVEMETEVFLNATIPLVMSTVGRAPLRIVTGMLGLLIERNDLLRLAKTKPGLAFLTVFLTRAETLKAAASAAPPAEGDNSAPPPEPIASQADLDQYMGTFNHLFHRLTTSAQLNYLFPSTRSVPFGAGLYAQHSSPVQHESILDAEDEPVWHFLAALAVSSDMTQQQVLVTEVRDKVLENVQKASRAAAAASADTGDQHLAQHVAQAKIRNANTFLHALGLDASQITVE